MSDEEVYNTYNLEIKFGKAIGILKGLGSKQLFSDAEPLKYGYRLGLETLIVHTLNWWALYVRGLTFVYQLTRKCLAWGVRLQWQNLKRLAGVCMNGGACGLIR